MATSFKITALHVKSNTQGASYGDQNGSNVANFKFCQDPKISLKVSPTWSSDAAYGKMDDIPFYTNTKKTYDISFKALPQKGVYTIGQLHSDVAKLYRFMYPVYSKFPNGVTAIKAPPFFNLQHSEFGGASKFKVVQGYITELSIIGGSEQGKIIRGIDRNSKQVLESFYEIKFNMTVLHGRVQGYDDQGLFDGDYMFNFEQNKSGGAQAFGSLAASEKTDTSLQVSGLGYSPIGIGNDYLPK